MTTNHLRPVPVSAQELFDVTNFSKLFFYPEGEFDSGFMLPIKQVFDIRSSYYTDWVDIGNEKYNYAIIHGSVEGLDDTLFVPLDDIAINRAFEEFFKNRKYMRCIFL